MMWLKLAINRLRGMAKRIVGYLVDDSGNYLTDDSGRKLKGDR